ncbi:DUF6265 family protein [Algoriphagus sp. CAU 1675]|uniref:DUF6265 family protein n=1 Tax=Algoriphagus sp. CAU 1675 TaxID=3032597 RepID=UPI0023DBC3FB|nr:DUF6265 family protein [Algoriphagus sp. CAU 1675]MDF2158387.1 DUF6265 family protein [Algoriphagus sp. CAU 1675]
MKTLFAISLFLIFNQSLFSQVRQLEPEQPPGKANIEDFSWMVGYWSGPGLEGECEEVWMPAVDGHMIGTFRFWENGKLVFSEFMNLIQEGESISMKLKHFSSDLTGWEEKEEWTTFQLIELGNKKAWFNGMTIERDGEKLIIQVNISENGQQRIEKFNYSKNTL